MTALERLIEAVEAGTGGNYSEWDAFATDHSLPICAIDEAANGSFDAALAVKNAITPLLTLSGLHEYSGMWSARLMPGEYYASAATPARALLLATLKAYREKQDA